MATKPLSWNRMVPASRIIRRLRGGSRPLLVQALDGFYYVVKFLDNPQGQNVPFNEGMGTELYRACGLNVCPWRFVIFPKDLLDWASDHFPGPWPETARPNSGLAFGSRCVDSADGEPYEILAGGFHKIANRQQFWMSWLLDSCALHADGRQVVFRGPPEGSTQAFFIDFGHMFGGPEGAAVGHPRARRYFDIRVYADISFEGIEQLKLAARALDGAALRRRSEDFPGEWRTESAKAAFSRCTERLSDAKFVAQTLESMLDEHKQKKRGALAPWLQRGHPEKAVLPCALQAGDLAPAVRRRGDSASSLGHPRKRQVAGPCGPEVA